MKTMTAFALLSLCAACQSTSMSLRPGSTEGKVAQQQFDLIKSLAGSWTTTSTMEEMPGTLEVRYRVVGGGSVVEEDFMPGHPHEMISMYHMDNGRLMMTHYCAVGNQPRMTAEPCSALDEDCPELRFRFRDCTNLASANDGHMREMDMTIVDRDTFSSKWTFFKDGKADHSAKFRWTRASTPNAKTVIINGDEVVVAPAAGDAPAIPPRVTRFSKTIFGVF